MPFFSTHKAKMATKSISLSNYNPNSRKPNERTSTKGMQRSMLGGGLPPQPLRMYMGTWRMIKIPLREAQLKYPLRKKSSNFLSD